MKTLNITKYIDDVGGSRDLRMKLLSAGHDFPIRTIESWKQRNAVGGHGILAIQDAIKQKKIKIRLEKYAINTTVPSDGNPTQTTV